MAAALAVVANDGRGLVEGDETEGIVGDEKKESLASTAVAPDEEDATGERVLLSAVAIRHFSTNAAATCRDMP